jgi:hypothetical protein
MSNLIHYVPYKSFTILTPDTVDIVQQRLSQCPFYRGTVTEEGFKITRNYYRGTGVLIKGRFEAQSHQIAVHIQIISLHPFYIALLGFIFLFWYGIAVPNAFDSAKYIYAKRQITPIYPDDGNIVKSIVESVGSASEGTMPNHLAVMYLALPVVILIILLGVFWLDAKQIRRSLTQVIRGKI